MTGESTPGRTRRAVGDRRLVALAKEMGPAGGEAGIVSFCVTFSTYLYKRFYSLTHYQIKYYNRTKI